MSSAEQQNARAVYQFWALSLVHFLKNIYHLQRYLHRLHIIGGFEGKSCLSSAAQHLHPGARALPWHPAQAAALASFSWGTRFPQGCPRFGSGRFLRLSTWYMETCFSSLLLQDLTQSLWKNAWKRSDFLRIIEQFGLEVTLKGHLVKPPPNLDTTLVTFI